MNCLKKTIVLSNKKDGYRALCVLTLLKSRQGTFGAFRAYDLKPCSAILGISINNKQVYKQNVEIVNNKTYNFKLDNSFDIDGKIGCVLVENNDGKLNTIVYGASEEIKDYKSVVVDGLNNAINNVFAKRLATVSKSSSLEQSNKKFEVNNENLENPKIEQISAKLEETQENTFPPYSKNYPNKDMGESIAKEKKDKCFPSDLETDESVDFEDDRIEDKKDKHIKEENFSSFDEIHNKGLEEKYLKETLREEFESENKRLRNEALANNFEEMAGSLTLDNSSSMEEVEEKIIEPKTHKNAELFESCAEDVEKEIQDALNKDNEFYNMISEQIDELFVKYPREERLEKLIPESKWVKVDYENDGHIYVIGLIYENGVLQYVCYGVPGEFSIEPPKNLEKYSQWLPLNPSTPEGEGYWIMYQDADTGEAVELSF